MEYKILIIDDEHGILEVVQAYLKKEGYLVYTAINGKEGYELFNNVKPDFIILDLMLPDMSGEEICKKIREISDVPILMLTAKGEEVDRINGLKIGADDYLVKPFSPKELVMRVNVIIKRVYKKNIKINNLIFNNGELIIEIEERIVKKNGKKIELTKNEFEILKVLARNPGKTLTREQLIESAFGYDYNGYDRTVDVYIKTLRKKIEDSKEPKYIITVYGVGYKFKGD